MTEQFKIEWLDYFREPRSAPDPDYPTGKDVDCSSEGIPNCVAALPYPAKRCGMYMIECTRCGLRVGCTTAGRPDDPRSIRISCNRN